MDNRTVLNGIQIGIGFIPFAVLNVGFFTQRYIIAVVSLIFCVAAVCLLPLFRKRANLWAFVFLSAASPAINIYIIFMLWNTDLFYENSVVMNLLTAVLYYFILFSVEQIAFGTVIRIIRDKIL